ncbi:unnamed protein product [Nezara viridula]|uniref:Uncharacterized protein n=1 Tax=Nezara viridula TaxID=85310 RepID=A0A9P0MT37_NEZVI|nr:unnamed protein product [Nezara viridula]
MISSPLMVHEKIWLDKPKYDAAERRYYERLAKSSESAKVANSTIVTDQQDNAGLSEGQDAQVSLNDSCPISDVMSPSKIHLGKLDNSEDTMIKEGKIEPCSAQLEEDTMKPDLSIFRRKSVYITPQPKDSLKLIRMSPGSSQRPVSESGAQAIANHSKSVSLNKATENESSCSPQTTKVEVGSKSEKPKKTDVNSRDNTLSKSEVIAQMKIETGDITCSKGKGQNKTKVADDKGLKQEFVPDKGSFIDPVSEVVKVINVGRFCGMIIFVVVSLL